MYDEENKQHFYGAFWSEDIDGIWFTLVQAPGEPKMISAKLKD